MFNDPVELKRFSVFPYTKQGKMHTPKLLVLLIFLSRGDWGVLEARTEIDGKVQKRTELRDHGRRRNPRR